MSGLLRGREKRMPRPSTPRPKASGETVEPPRASRYSKSSSSSAESSTEEESGVSHFSVSTILGLRGITSLSSGSNIPLPITTPAGRDNYKEEKARSLLRMLLRNQKLYEESSPPTTDVHNLIPCGDVAGLLAVNVKQCKDFTSRFNVKRDTYLLIRISIDKIMKCTNPQMYKAFPKEKKMNEVYFGDVRYFSVKVPQQKSDPRNRIVLELVGFEGPKDFPRLFGNVTMHLYKVIQKQSFTEMCAMRIRNTIFCTVEVQLMFCYGCLGYGYSHQLKLPGSDPAQAVAYSMFLRVPPPEDRKDPISNVIKPQQLDYPAFLSPDLSQPVGKVGSDASRGISEYYSSLQKALKEPPGARLEKMKKEYRTLKTWNEKSDYLDQLILKHGPKERPERAKSRFREIVERIHNPPDKENAVSPPVEQPIAEEKIEEPVIEEEKTEPPITEEKIEDVIQKTSSIISDLSKLNLQMSPPTPSCEESESDLEPEKCEVCEPTEDVENPPLAVTSSSDHLPRSSSDVLFLEQKITREKIASLSETSLSSSGEITAEFSDYESPPFIGPGSKIMNEKISVIETPSLESLPKPTESPYKTPKESYSDSGIHVRISDSVVEPKKQWPWKEVKFQETFLSGNKFEPFLRRVCKVEPPALNKNKIDYSSILEKAYPPIDTKEQEDQDPPHEQPLAKADSGDTKLIKAGEQLSILRLIERKMDLEEEDKKLAMTDGKEKEPSTITSGGFHKSQTDKLSEEEIQQVNVYFRNSLEIFLVDKVVKVIALESLLSKNIEPLVAERLAETEIPQELEGSSSLSDKDKHLLGERKVCSTDILSEPEINQLKNTVSQNLQAQLIGKLSEKGIIPDMELAADNQKSYIQSSSDLIKERSLSKDMISQTDIITIKALSESYLDELSKLESVPSKERSKPVVTEAKLSKTRKDDNRSLVLYPHKSAAGDDKESNPDLKYTPSKKSLEIIKVRLPFSAEPDNIKQQYSIHDPLLQKILKAEIRSLKSFLNKGIHDHLKDKLSESGFSAEDLETVCHKLSSNVKGVSNEAFNQIMLSESVQRVLGTLSDNELANLKSSLNKRIQVNLLKRISEIGLIMEDELKKALGTVIPIIVKETALKAAKGSDISKEEQSSQQSLPQLTLSLQDRFSEEELQNLKSLCSRLLKEGRGDRLSENEVKGLASVLRKTSEEIPSQSISETGISSEVKLKDDDRKISLPNVESISKVSSVALPDKGKHSSYEKLHNISTAELCTRGNMGLSASDIETRSQETQTSPPKKAKHHKKESHRMPGYPDNIDASDLRRGPFEEALQSKPQEPPIKPPSDPFACSSFLSAHDIGSQPDMKNYLSKSSHYSSKPPFPVNPQTFHFLHSESEEEAKAGSRHHQKSKSRKADKKKDAALLYPQQGVLTQPVRKEKTSGGSASKEVLKEKGKKHGELSSKKSNTAENRKDSKTTLSSGKKESSKQKSEKKRDSEAKPKKSSSKTANLSDSHSPKNIQEKSSTVKFPTTGHTKGNPLNSIVVEDLDLEAYKHLEKAIERALLDLQGVDEGSSSPGRSNTVLNAAGLPSKDASRPYSTAMETPRNQAGSISDMLNNQDQTLKMSPEQLEGVLKLLHKILRQNTRPPNNG